MSGATQNKDGTKKRWIHGRAVQDGKLRFLSVSSLEKGDSSKPTGCLRRWHYQYIGGVKETEQSDALIRGEKLHGEIAHYLTTGEQVLSSQVLAGMHIIPEPGPDLKVEHDIVPNLPDGRSGIIHAPLRAAGVPIVGAIDLIHARGTNKGTEDIEHIHDPVGTIEVIDWKTCRTMDNAKKGPDLLKTIQMSGYGKYIFEVEPDATFVRLSHGYFPSKGVPRKTTIRVDRDQINKSWEHANHVASSIVDAAKENNPDLVEANTEACMSYGRECPARSICSAVKTNALSMFVGNVLAEQIIPPGNLLKNMSEANTSNSILATIKAGGSALPEPRANRSIFGSIGQAPTPPSEPVQEDTEITRIKADLASRERLAKGPELLPPDAPESNPMLASKPNPVNPFTMAMAAVAENDTPVIDTKEVVATMVKDAPEAPKRRGRKPKVTEPDTVPGTPVTPTVPDFSDVDPIAIPVINFFVDCAPDAEHENFWELVDHLSAKLTEQSGLPDFRMATEGDLAFGRWKGFYAAMLRATKIEPGNYTLPHAYGEVAQVVIEVMRDVVRKSGGMFVTGSR